MQLITCARSICLLKRRLVLTIRQNLIKCPEFAVFVLHILSLAVGQFLRSVYLQNQLETFGCLENPSENSLLGPHKNRQFVTLENNKCINRRKQKRAPEAG